MNKNKIILLVSLLVIIVAFVVFLTIYRFEVYDNEKNYFTWTLVSTQKDNKNISETLDKETYKEYIIEEDIKKLDYTFLEQNKSITGTIYIGNDEYLYISDVNSNINYKLSTIKFKTMYTKDIEYEKGIYVYLITENGKLYYYSLETNDIRKGALNEVPFPNKVLKFTSLDFRRDAFETYNTLFVLADDGNIYDVASKLRFDFKIKSLYGNLYVFDDNTMTNEYGRILVDENNIPYKIKNIFETGLDNEFTGENTRLIITENNELLYMNSNTDYVYKYARKVKSVDFDVNNPYIKGKLKLTFEDDSYIDLNAECNQYYCVNDFVN